MTRFGVIVVGGGVAGLEALLRLRQLGGDQLDLTLISPADTLVYRPQAVLAPFETGYPRRYPVGELTRDLDVCWVPDSLRWVERDSRTVHTARGHVLAYDALLVALGGRKIAPTDSSFAFSDQTADAYRDILTRAVSGEIDSLLYAVPGGPGWPLPLYELALLTAARLRQAGRTPNIAICTPGPRPLEAFGGEAGDAVAAVLDESGIELYTDSTATLTAPGRVLLRPSGVELHADQVITQPRISGPNVRGLPGEAADRFLQVDRFCRVRGTDGRIFAAGDATHLPVKQGGIGAQQADTAAAGIAHLAGLAEEPSPLHPIIHGVLLTGGSPLYLTAHVIAERNWYAQLTSSAPWPVEEKIVAAELSPYLKRWDTRRDDTSEHSPG